MGLNISEKDYITVTNRVKVSTAKDMVQDILPGFDGVITKDEKMKVLQILYKWEDALFSKIND